MLWWHSCFALWACIRPAGGRLQGLKRSALLAGDIGAGKFAVAGLMCLSKAGEALGRVRNSGCMGGEGIEPPTVWV
jgi:hypothetical protein